MRKAIYNHGFMRAVCVIITTVFIFSGCKKASWPADAYSDGDLFTVADSQPVLIKQIAARIKVQDQEHSFMTQLCQDEGYPLWNKSQIVTTEGETLAYIPLVLENTEYVNGYILYRQKGTYKSMELIRGRDYNRYGFAPGSRSHAIAGNLIRLNNFVFGTTKFMLMDNRLFGLNKVSRRHTPLLLEYKSQPLALGAEGKATAPGSASSSTTPFEEDIPTLIDEDPAKECARFVFVSNCGVHMDSGNYNCYNLYVTFLSTPCTEPPSPPPFSPAGYEPAGSDTGGASSGLPGLNINMPPCPTGMSQSECDALTVPVMNYLLSTSPFTNLHAPTDSPEEPIIQNGIDVADVDDFSPPGTGSRPIAHTRPRGNVEDMTFGTTGDVSGITASLVPLDDELLFADMRALFSACTIFDNNLGQVGNLMINKFRNRDRAPFQNNQLNRGVSQSVSLINFAKRFGDELRTKLQATGGNIDAIASFETNGYRPIFNGLHNKFHGLQILINDTEFTEIELDNFYIDSDGNWNALVTITIHDHFGLDKNDALSFQRFHSGFASWWLLQHTRGYTPYETVIKVRKEIKGKL